MTAAFAVLCTVLFALRSPSQILFGLLSTAIWHTSMLLESVHDFCVLCLERMLSSNNAHACLHSKFSPVSLGILF